MIAYLSQNADKIIIDALKQEDFEVKLLAPFRALENPVSTHADMLLLALGDTVFVHKDYENKINLENFKNIVKVDEPVGAKYPNDILFNVAIVGNHAFCNVKHASGTVLDHLKREGYFIHHVSQGYAHCSTLIVDENAIITADEGIANAAREAGIDVLKISSGHISLPPYDYGFIGGASGSTDSAVYFCGSLEHHPDGESIRKFIEAHRKSAIEFSPAPLSDVGGILFA